MGARELFVISDLHLGGTVGQSMCARAGAHEGQECDEPDRERGFRLNTHVTALATFITQVAERDHRTAQAELVINGDFCDFLAEIKDDGIPRPFIADPDEALAAFDAIAERDSEVFDALRELVARGHRLTLMLGNHDVELALPAVRTRLRNRLGIGASSSFEFIYDNEAYVVGDVIIEHGNRYDGWNTIAHDALRRIRSWQSRRLAPVERVNVTPPPGSVLVAQIINEVKARYAFVDLLKPEGAATLPILLALDPSLRTRIASVAALATKAAAHAPVRAAEPRFAGDIGASSSPAGFSMDLGTGAEETPDALRRAVEEALGAEAADFLREIEAVSDDGFAHDISASETSKKLWGFAGLTLWPAKTRAKRMSSLLTAVRGLQNDATFELGGPEKRPYREAAERLVCEGGFRVVVFGHTHLARDLEIETDGARPNGRYLNTGTWADLMRFPREVVSGTRDEALGKLTAFAEDLAENRTGRRITFLPTYAHIKLDAHGFCASARIEIWE